MHLLFADEKKLRINICESNTSESIIVEKGTKATNVPLMYPHERLHHRTYFLSNIIQIIWNRASVACFRWDTRCTVMSRVRSFCDDHISSLFNLTLHAQTKYFWWNIVNYKRINRIVYIESLSNRLNREVKA